MPFVAVLLLYDHALTLSAECTSMWRKPLSKPSLWFFLNRYPAALGNIIVCLNSFTSFVKEDKVSRARLTVSH